MQVGAGDKGGQGRTREDEGGRGRTREDEGGREEGGEERREKRGNAHVRTWGKWKMLLDAQVGVMWEE